MFRLPRGVRVMWKMGEWSFHAREIVYDASERENQKFRESVVVNSAGIFIWGK